MPTNSTSAIRFAAQGVLGGYDGDSLALKVIIGLMTGLTMYNALELVVLVLMTFRRYRGLYFWSLLISSLGLIPYALGFCLKFFTVLKGDARWVSVVLLSVGWYPMVTGQSIVLWSRLHLIVSGERGRKILKYTKWMIIVDAIILHIPTSVVTFGSNGTRDTATFVEAYNIIEKTQMTGFFIQEVILSSIYIVETIRILRVSLQDQTRRLMQQLVFINIVIILMDAALLGIEYASLYLLETVTKGVCYSIKLKLEFAILSRLVKFVGGADRSTGFINSESSRSKRKDEVEDITEFVDTTRTMTDVTHASQQSKKSPSRAGMDDADIECARFAHVERAVLKKWGNGEGDNNDDFEISERRSC